MRLVDADHLLSVAESEFNEEDMFKIRWLVHHLPTKYDVEKVVAEIEKKRHIDRSCGDVDYSIYESEAIEIVRKGGVE